jgi:hypothetical protein
MRHIPLIYLHRIAQRREPLVRLLSRCPRPWCSISRYQQPCGVDERATPTEAGSANGGLPGILSRGDLTFDRQTSDKSRPLGRPSWRKFDKCPSIPVVSSPGRDRQDYCACALASESVWPGSTAFCWAARTGVARDSNPDGSDAVADGRKRRHVRRSRSARTI